MENFVNNPKHQSQIIFPERRIRQAVDQKINKNNDADGGRVVPSETRHRACEA